MFWDNFYALCFKNNITPNGLAKILSFSSGSITTWKNGAVPHHDTLLKIANYFNVSVDYLLGQPEELSPTVEAADSSITAQEAELLKVFRNLNEINKARLLIYGAELMDK